MLIYDVLHKEKLYEIVVQDLKSIGVKYRIKRSIFKTDKIEKNKNISRTIFKTPLSYQPLDVVNLSSGGIVHIPTFVSQASTFLEKHITQEGLFRKAGSQVRQKELMIRLDNGSSLGEKHNAIDVANCLKTFFRDLPEPLIPYIYHDLFLHCVMLKTRRIQALLMACILLPAHNLNTLAFLMEFLKKVSLYEKQNKMSIDNLAKVIGPNIMPLQEPTISAVQTRLEMHLIIIKILIENAQQIGVLPEHITQIISSETIGSTENELNVSDSQSHGKLKKNKHRSGSLTRKPHLSATNLNLRMFNGLKKIVGKSGSPDNASVTENLHTTNFNSLYTSSTKNTKKRKVMEQSNPRSTKKKKVYDKLEKSKKTRLSLDRFVSKNKQKNMDTDSESCLSNFNSCAERSWSSISNSSNSHEKNKIYNDGLLQFQSALKENEVSGHDFRNDYNSIFIDANINLSDDNSEQVLLKKDNHKSVRQWHTRSNNIKQLKLMDDHCECISLNSIKDDECEEYVRIPKSEYEEIKNRVSAIETRISQEFGCIHNGGSDILTGHSVNKVQSEYEKTLEEASIESIITTDQLARRLGKELKIRRSEERKIIRSPSARKIGSLRRRSQEKITSKRANHISTWDISQEIEHRHKNQFNGQSSDNYLSKKQLTCTELPSKIVNTVSNSTYSKEKNIKLNLLHEKLNALISHTSVHNKSLLNDDKLNFISTNSQNCVKSSVRRASSFHGNEFVKNSLYLDTKVKELKKTNSQQDIILDNNYQNVPNTALENWRKSANPWKDADDYFKSTSQTTPSFPQTGRASIAKLRTQNAGMVLAKAKLFDKKTSEMPTFISDNILNKKNNTNKKQTLQEIDDINAELFDSGTKNTTASCKKFNKCTKSRNLKAIQSSHMHIRSKTNLMNTASEMHQQNSERIRNHKSSQKLNINKEKIDINIRDNVKCNSSSYQKENVTTEKIIALKNISMDAMLENQNMKIYKSDNGLCKTPHIKKSLTVKTPRSSKSLMRKSAMDMRRTPLKAVVQLDTSKYQSPKSISKSRTANTYNY